MKRFKFANIKLSVAGAWKVCVIAFLAIIVIISILDVYIFVNIGEDITSPAGTSASPASEVVNKTSFEKAISELAARRAIFEKNLKEKPNIKDPSI